MSGSGRGMGVRDQTDPAACVRAVDAATAAFGRMALFLARFAPGLLDRVMLRRLRSGRDTEEA